MKNKFLLLTLLLDTIFLAEGKTIAPGEGPTLEDRLPRPEYDKWLKDQYNKGSIFGIPGIGDSVFDSNNIKKERKSL